MAAIKTFKIELNGKTKDSNSSKMVVQNKKTWATEKDLLWCILLGNLNDFQIHHQNRVKHQRKGKQSILLWAQTNQVSKLNKQPFFSTTNSIGLVAQLKNHQLLESAIIKSCRAKKYQKQWVEMLHRSLREALQSHRNSQLFSIWGQKRWMKKSHHF